jgi:nitrite reductase/ring-hydroxylating ferredoxin subunit
MEWVKVFSSGREARERLKENVPQLLHVGEVSICLVLRESVIHAIENKCSHNGESLCKGKINYLGEVVCPWHGHRFNLKTGRECAERSRDLQIYPVMENDKGIFVGL